MLGYRLKYFQPPGIKIRAEVSGVEIGEIDLDEGKLLFLFLMGYLKSPASNSYLMAQASRILRDFVATYTGREPKINLLSPTHLLEAYKWDIYRPFIIDPKFRIYGPSILEYLAGYVPPEKLLEVSGVKPPQTISGKFEKLCKKYIRNVPQELKPLGTPVASRNEDSRKVRYLVINPRDPRILQAGVTDHPLKDIATGDPKRDITDQRVFHREWVTRSHRGVTGIEDLDKAILYKVISDTYRIPVGELRKLEKHISLHREGLLSKFAGYITGRSPVRELEVFLLPYRLPEEDFRYLSFSIEGDLKEEYTLITGFYSSGNLYIVSVVGRINGPSAVFNPVHLVRNFLPAIDGLQIGKGGVKLTPSASRVVYAYAYTGLDFAPYVTWEEVVPKLKFLWERYSGVAIPLPARYFYLNVRGSVLAILFPELSTSDIEEVKLLHISAPGRKASVEGLHTTHIPLMGSSKYHPVIGGPSQTLLKHYGKRIKRELDKGGRTAYRINYSLKKEYSPDIKYTLPVGAAVTFGRGEKHLNIIEVIVYG